MAQARVSSGRLWWNGVGGSGREWERMPESVNGEGGKASKGEYGFRYGASVPRPMLMAFSKVLRVHARGSRE